MKINVKILLTLILLTVLMSISSAYAISEVKPKQRYFDLYG